MNAERELTATLGDVPPWFRPITFALLPRPATPLLHGFLESLSETLCEHGHTRHPTPCESTDLVLTTSAFGEVVDWRKAPLFTLPPPADAYRAPDVCTLVHATESRLRTMLEDLTAALGKEEPERADYDFPGLGPNGYRIVHEQGRRGGPILALGRLLQVQSKSVRVMLVVGDTMPTAAYHFDLVGAHPCTRETDARAFLRDVALRLMTAAAGELANRHRARGEPVPRMQWEHLSTVADMQEAVADSPAQASSLTWSGWLTLSTCRSRRACWPATTAKGASPPGSQR